MERVLIIFPGALGDLICLAPTMAAIARRHRGAEVELMAREELAQFAVGRLGIVRGHSIDRREMTLLFRESAEVDDQARRFFSEFHRIYSFFNSDDPRFRRTLFEASKQGAVTLHPFRPPGDGHVASAHLHVASAYLNDVTGRSVVDPIALNFMPADLESAARAISGIVEPKQFVAIFPGSGSASKNWPLERVIELAKRIGDRSRAVFITGPAEDPMRDRLSESGYTVLHRLPLGTVAAIARMASVFIGNDSGVSHLASAVGTRGVVLFGATNPNRWRPLGKITVIHRQPIDEIEVDEVIAAIEAPR